MRVWIRCLAWSSLALAVSQRAAAAAFPGAAWPGGTPEAVGLDPAPLAKIDAMFAGGEIPLMDSYLVVRCGELVLHKTYTHDYGKIYYKEAHERGPLNPHLTGRYNYFDPRFHPYLHDTREHTQQSVSKSVTATVLGVAIARGDFKSSLDTPVLHWFEAAKVRNVDARKQRMTLRHVLTMTTGLDWNEDVAYNDPRNSTAPMEASEDWVGFVINLPMAFEPGKHYAYSSGATELLAHIFRQETGFDIEVYAKAFLFRPLGIRSHHWKRTPMGVVDTEGGLYLTDEDMARVGYLYLKGGKWNGTQLVDAGFLKQALTPQVEAGHDMEGLPPWQYGFQWWLLPYEPGRLMWAARGFGGQRILVFPQDELIVVTTQWDILRETEAIPKMLPLIRQAVKPHACTATH